MGAVWDTLTGKKKDDYSDWKSGETPAQYEARKKADKKPSAAWDTLTAPARARTKLIGAMDGKKDK